MTSEDDSKGDDDSGLTGSLPPVKHDGVLHGYRLEGDDNGSGGGDGDKIEDGNQGNEKVSNRNGSSNKPQDFVVRVPMTSSESTDRGKRYTVSVEDDDLSSISTEYDESGIVLARAPNAKLENRTQQL